VAFMFFISDRYASCNRKSVLSEPEQRWGQRPETCVSFGTVGADLGRVVFSVGEISAERHPHDHIQRISAICPRMHQVGCRNPDRRISKTPFSTLPATGLSLLLLSTVLKNRGLKAAQIRRSARRLKSHHRYPFLRGANYADQVLHPRGTDVQLAVVFGSIRTGRRRMLRFAWEDTHMSA